MSSPGGRSPALAARFLMGEHHMAFRLTSSAFDDGEKIPSQHTREWDNLSPPLAWHDVPEGTVQLALIVDDPDAPREEPFVHWVCFAIPADRSGLPEGVDRNPQVNKLGGLAQGKNDFGEIGYDGPQPPPGTGEHHYCFELFALDRPLQLQPAVDHKALRAAMAGKVRGSTTLVGTYAHAEERVATS